MQKQIPRAELSKQVGESRFEAARKGEEGGIARIALTLFDFREIPFRNGDTGGEFFQSNPFLFSRLGQPFSESQQFLGETFFHIRIDSNLRSGIPELPQSLNC